MAHIFLAIDDQSIPLRKNLSLYLTKPSVRPEAVLKASPFGSGAPDDSAACFYGTVLQDSGKFRMWYYACHWGKNLDWPPLMLQQVALSPSWSQDDCQVYQGPLCYAESDDGLTWSKPALGQVLFKGSRQNNALALPHTLVSGALVLKDDADPDPTRRYKMAYQFFPDQSQPVIEEYGRMPSLATAVSPDGITWHVTGIPYRGQFVEPSSFIKYAGQFVVHYQVMDTWANYSAEGGTPCGRTGAARISPDFEHWPDFLAETFALPEPEDKSRRGPNGAYDQVHLGVGAASFGNVCVGLYGLWHNAENSQTFDQISGDFGLLVSNDGIHFREPVKGYRFLRRDESPVTPAPGYNFNTILCQANGILNVGDETRIYHGRWRNAGGNKSDDTLQYFYSEVALAILPRDRWGALSLMPGQNEGALCTALVTLPAQGASLRINADGAGELEVALLDEAFNPIPGFEKGQVSGPGGLDCPVAWDGLALAQVGSRPIRILVQLKRTTARPRVYAIYLESPQLSPF